MKRGYTMALYRKRVEMLRTAMPDLELVSDWIVGFPGETDADFEQSAEAMEEFNFLQSFVFQYSPRPGTVAFEIEDDIPKAAKAKRNHRLLDLQRSIARQRSPRLVGNADSVMLESRSDRNPGYWLGRTRSGHYALLEDQKGLAAGREVPVQLLEHNGRELMAQMIGELEPVANFDRQEFPV